jgi:hypothetical protein
MQIEEIRAERRQCVEELVELGGWVRGSLVQSHRMQANKERPFRYLSRSVKGRNRITYVAADKMAAFRSAQEAGQRAAVLFEHISELTIAILRARNAECTGGAQ